MARPDESVERVPKHVRRKHRALAIVVAVGTFSAALASPSTPINVAASDNAFGFRLLNAVQKTKANGNVVLSPMSAALDLSIALNGAVDQTRQEMLSALSLGGSDLDAINNANAQLIKIILTPSKSVTLAVADSLWVDRRRATLRPEYIKGIQAVYNAEMDDFDFSSPTAAKQINEWACKETHGKIPEVIHQLDPADVALLLNAVYFKGQWAHKFDKSKTRQRDFTLADGAVKQVSRMARSGQFDYFEAPDMQAIRLPFGDGDLVMEVLLPTKSSTLAALEAGLTPDLWNRWQAYFAPRSGKIELPRFELKSNYRLNQALQTLGIRRAFNHAGPDAAQFTDMLSSPPGAASRENFFISSVQQSTYWKVDEDGSEAAAVTTIQMRTMAAARPEQPFHMIVDRPFFCVIEDRRSGALLFVGAIYDPSLRLRASPIGPRDG